jgi:hypothetical protein
MVPGRFFGSPVPRRIALGFGYQQSILTVAKQTSKGVIMRIAIPVVQFARFDLQLAGHCYCLTLSQIVIYALSKRCGTGRALRGVQFWYRNARIVNDTRAQHELPRVYIRKGE